MPDGLIGLKDHSINMTATVYNVGMCPQDVKGLIRAIDAYTTGIVASVDSPQKKPKRASAPRVSADEQRARLVLLFERLPKLLGKPDKVAKQKLRKEFPHFARVASKVIQGYAEHGDAYYEAIEEHLEELVPGGGEELMKYTKYFTGLRSDSGSFQSASAFLVTADEPPMLVAKCTKVDHEVEVPHGTVEAKDLLYGCYREAAAIREAQEELEVTFEADLCSVRPFLSRQATCVTAPQVSEEALGALADFVRTSLSELPKTPEEHASALLALDRIVGVEGKYPNLLSHASKWFDAKDWIGFIVPVAPWAEFQTTLGLQVQTQKSKLTCLPLDGSQHFRIVAGLHAGSVLEINEWDSLNLSDEAKGFLQSLIWAE